MAGTLVLPSDVISVLKDHGFDDYTDPQFLVILNAVQNDLCALEPWPLLEAPFTFPTVAASNVLTLPANFGAMLHLVNTTTGYALIPERWDVIEKNYPNYLAQQAAPQYYYFKGELAFMYPVPDGVYALQGGIQTLPTQLTAVSDAFTWPSRHLWVIVYGSLVKLFNLEDDLNMANFYQAAYDNQLTRAREDLWKRQYDRFDRIYDVTDDTWY